MGSESSVLETLQRLSSDLVQELQKPLYNPVTVEHSLQLLFQGINHLSTPAETKLQIAKLVISPSLYQHEVLAEFCFRHAEFALLKEFNLKEFKLRFQQQLPKLKSIPEQAADDAVYFEAIRSLTEMQPLLPESEKNELYEIIGELLTLPYLSPRLFLLLIPLASLKTQKEIGSIKFSQWETQLIEGLQKGELGMVHDCLCALIFPDYAPYLEPGLLKSTELGHPLRSLKSLETVPLVLKTIVDLHLQKRLAALKKYQASSISQAFIQSIEESHELGVALRKSYLCELTFSGKCDETLLSLYLAIEKMDLPAIEQLLTSPLQELPNGETPISIATQVAAMGQKGQQKFFKNSYDDLYKQKTEAFYFAFHKLCKELLFRNKNPWKKVTEMIELAAFSANEISLGKKMAIRFGKWDNPAEFYLALFQIYLPQEEHGYWKKYICGSAGSDLHLLQNKMMRVTFKGSQEAYGLWFHLCSKCAVEEIALKKSWKEILQLLGHLRKMAALFFINVQVPLGKSSLLSTRMKQSLIDKEWPGSPLNFGVRTFDHEESYTSVIPPLRIPYIEKIKALIGGFEKDCKGELSREIAHATCGGREIFAYSLYKNSKSYVILCPFQINSRKVVGTIILWGWPPHITFFYPRHQPVKLPNYNMGRWIHATGKDKQEIDCETERLFTQLLSEKEHFETVLGRFIFLFSQSLPFKRGTAAVGLILMNALLTIQGRVAPDAPPALRFLDCEAMCSTDEEFIKGFVAWLNGAEFFKTRLAQRA